MFLKIISPQSVIYEDEVELVQLPGSVGPFTILHNHAPLIAKLDKGRIKIVDKNSIRLFKGVDSGFAEVSNNTITVLTDKEVPLSLFDKHGIIREPTPCDTPISTDTGYNHM